MSAGVNTRTGASLSVPAVWLLWVAVAVVAVGQAATDLVR